MREGTEQHRVVSPATHVTASWKSTNTHTHTDVICCLLHAAARFPLSGRVAQEGKQIVEVSSRRRGQVGTFPARHNWIELSFESWGKNLHPDQEKTSPTVFSKCSDKHRTSLTEPVRQAEKMFGIKCVQRAH